MPSDQIYDMLLREWRRCCNPPLYVCLCVRVLGVERGLGRGECDMFALELVGELELNVHLLVSGGDVHCGAD